ncbi:hypothetical protein Tco_0401195 [Tanacetum coccineum]
MYTGKNQSKNIDEFHKLVGDLAAIDTIISDEDQTLLLLKSLPPFYDNFYRDVAFWSSILELRVVLVTINSRELTKVDRSKRAMYDSGNILLGDGRECRVWGQVRFKFTMRMVNFILTTSGTRRDNYVNTLDGQAVTRKTLKESYMNDFEEWGHQNIWVFAVIPVSRMYGLSKVLWAEDTTMSTYLVNKWIINLWRLDDVTSKVVLDMNMGFNESVEYKKTFIGSGVGTGSVQVLQGVDFEVEPQEDHAFEVEPLRNVGQGAEDINEAASKVAEAKKIYAHESLTFNNTVAYEVISKWKAGLKDDIDARSDVYVLNNGCSKYEVQTDMSVRGTRWQAEVSVRGTRYCSRWRLANQSVTRGIWRVSVRGGVCQYEVRVRESVPIMGNNEAVGRRQKDQNTLRSSNMSGG